MEYQGAVGRLLVFNIDPFEPYRLFDGLRVSRRVCRRMKCSKARSEERLKWPVSFSDLVQMKRLSASGRAFSNDVPPFQYVGGV